MTSSAYNTKYFVPWLQGLRGRQNVIPTLGQDPSCIGAHGKLFCLRSCRILPAPCNGMKAHVEGVNRRSGTPHTRQDATLSFTETFTAYPLKYPKMPPSAEDNASDVRGKSFVRERRTCACNHSWRHTSFCLAAKWLQRVRCATTRCLSAEPRSRIGSRHCRRKPCRHPSQVPPPSTWGIGLSVLSCARRNWWDSSAGVLQARRNCTSPCCAQLPPS